MSLAGVQLVETQTTGGVRALTATDDSRVTCPEGVDIVKKTAVRRSGSSARRALSAAALLLAAGAGLAACASDDSTSIAASGTTSDESVEAAKAAVEEASQQPTEISQSTPLEAAPAATGKVVFLQNAVPATAIIGNAVEDAVGVLGWDYEELSYDAANSSTLQAALRTALSKNATAVIVTGVSPDQYGKGPVAEFEKAGVPIVAAGVCLTEEYDFPIIEGPSGCEQEKEVGRILADWIIADSDGEAKILDADLPVFPSYTAMKEGLVAELKANCPGCSMKVVSLTAEQLGNGQVVPTLVNNLRSNPDVKYLVVPQSAMASGLKSALSAAGLKGIKVAGRQADEEQIGLLASSEDNAWTASSYPMLGYASVDTLLRHLQDTGTEDTSLVTPVQLLTKDNAGDVTAPYHEPHDALAQYKALWRVG